MANTAEQTIIKKYANRRLYNTGTSTYVTLEDLAKMVRDQEDFIVIDAKSGDNITRTVLTQIIFEQENKGQNLLPVAFLRQLIRYYGDSMQALVPSYLEYSIESFSKEQEKFRTQMSDTFGNSAIEAMEEQVKRNADMFERAMQMFIPFSGTNPMAPTKDSAAGSDNAEASSTQSNELDLMKEQMAQMQAQLNKLSAKD